MIDFWNVDVINRIYKQMSIVSDTRNKKDILYRNPGPANHDISECDLHLIDTLHTALNVSTDIEAHAALRCTFPRILSVSALGLQSYSLISQTYCFTSHFVFILP